MRTRIYKNHAITYTNSTTHNLTLLHTLSVCVDVNAMAESRLTWRGDFVISTVIVLAHYSGRQDGGKNYLSNTNCPKARLLSPVLIVAIT